MINLLTTKSTNLSHHNDSQFDKLTVTLLQFELS